MKRDSEHILVIGDLYVDHDIFLTEHLESTSDLNPDEIRFNVISRQDTAGGAANSARILSVLSDGETYLWGIVGSTHWGTFRGVLEKSHATDGIGKPIELRGVSDDTDPRMNTVTRLLIVGEDNPRIVQRRFGRYYDINHVHVSETKRETLIYHLERIYQKMRQLHAIVINDFGRGTLTTSLIEAVAQRAAHYGIPVFVDPLMAHTYEDRIRYSGIHGTAILPNLREWCALVGDSHGTDYWRRNLNDPDALREMAVRSFQNLPNFDYHIIKCDRDGALLFVPHRDKRHEYSLYHIESTPVNRSAPPYQLGCSDVMTAVFALEFPRIKTTTGDVLQAFQRANATVACYREMPWHQMPSRRDVDAKRASFPWTDPAPDADISKGVLFLPKMQRIDMSAYETAIKGLYSQDQVFKRNIFEFMKDITTEWSPEVKSIILGAPPGTGKTTIMKTIEAIGLSYGISTLNMTSTETGVRGLHTLSPTEFRKTFREMRIGRKTAGRGRTSHGGMPLRDAAGGHVLIFVDEALRDPSRSFLVSHAPTLLDSAHAEGVRFLFLSAGFVPELESAPEWREFFGRAHRYYFPNLEERPFDIPYIVAARFFEKRSALVKLEIEGSFLLAVTDLTLVTPEPRTVCAIVDEVLKVREEGTNLEITLKDLPDSYKASAESRRESSACSNFGDKWMIACAKERNTAG